MVIIKNIIKSTISVSKIIPSASLLLLLTLLIPSPHYYRNYALSGDIFGASDDHYFNQDNNIKSIGLGLLKNIGNHLSTPLTSGITNQIIEKSHIITKIPITDKKYSYNGIPFKLNKLNHNEDEVSNFIQILLFGLTFVVLILNFRNNSKLFNISTIFCLSTFFIFSFILKWQPWYIRLQVPFFIMLSIPSSILINQFSTNKLILALLFVTSIYCIVLLLFNPNRPIITTKKQANLNTRFEKYFIAMPLFLPEFKKWRYRIKKNIPTKWGVHGDTWEYPLYYDCFSKKRNTLNHATIINPSKKLIQ
jgi:hypothetical protein